jgi:hypothetical protein
VKLLDRDQLAKAGGPVQLPKAYRRHAARSYFGPNPITADAVRHKGFVHEPHLPNWSAQ